nr:hypothetical protein SYMBAF_70051 [Serratia symbiotica]
MCNRFTIFMCEIKVDYSLRWHYGGRNGAFKEWKITLKNGKLTELMWIFLSKNMVLPILHEKNNPCKHLTVMQQKRIMKPLGR